MAAPGRRRPAPQPDTAKILAKQACRHVHHSACRRAATRVTAGHHLATAAQAKARDYGSAPERVACTARRAAATSAARRDAPDDKRYAALPGPARRCVGRVSPSRAGRARSLDRYRLAQKLGKAELVKNHDVFWGSEAA